MHAVELLRRMEFDREVGGLVGEGGGELTGRWVVWWGEGFDREVGGLGGGG